MIPISGIAVFVLIGTILLIFIVVQPNNASDIQQDSDVLLDDVQPETESPTIPPSEDNHVQSTPTTIVSESSGISNFIVIAETLGLSDYQTNANSQNIVYNPGGGGGGGRIGNADNENNPPGEEISTPTYTLTLFEGGSPSDGVVTLGQEIKAVATTSNNNIVDVTFRWIAPNTIVADETVAQFHSPAEDIFAPGEPGSWIVQADFGNGVVLTEDMNVPFMVLPESAIGNLALIGSSLAALGGYYLVTKRNALNRSQSG